MKHKVTFGMLMIIALSAALFAQSAGELYQQALVQENGAGNLQNAIQLYQRAAKQAAGDRPLAALALMGAARCYEKLGKAESIRLYEEVQRSYPDQREQAAVAQERLTALHRSETEFGPEAGKPLQNLGNAERINFNALIEKLAELRRRQLDLAAKYTDKHPERVSVDRQIADLEKAIRLQESVSSPLLKIVSGHSIPAAFDPNNPVTLKGELYGFTTQVGPSVWMLLDVKNDTSGKAERWAVAGNSANTLAQAGWPIGPPPPGATCCASTRGSVMLKAGDVISLAGYRPTAGINLADTLPGPLIMTPFGVLGGGATGGSPRELFNAGRLVYGTEVTLPDGRKLIFGDGR